MLKKLMKARHVLLERKRMRFENAQSKRPSQLGMTLLEIMIVLAIIALVMGLFVGPKILGGLTSAEQKTYWMTARQFSDQAYPRWRADNPGKRCPASLADLTKYMNKQDISDYQENGKDLYIMFCGENAANVPNNFGVAYVGDDRNPDTADDIKSWEKAPKD